ncbi:leukocyte elastase inhibitor-like [Pollicipes pollicipes]|uniref:leukocyte elastase inhibitor-like n=1 Tax=Pollicipes pollicipes TaxID=41117 RepID=UPI0018855D6B|nr:leukocyte elastase inhibitor-like [Pollicipes pollicipes]
MKRNAGAWLAPFLLLATLGGACVPTDLDMKLLKEVTSGPVANHVISPFLMSLLMSQVWLGARGATRAEMTPVLGMSGPKDTSFLHGYRSALAVLSGASNGVTTSVYNRIYRKHSFSVRRTFSDLLARYYGAGVEVLPRDAGKAAEVINNQASVATRGHIKDLVTSADVSNAVLVLFSAVYFKGTWLYRFDKGGQKPFLTPRGDRPTNMMKLKAELGYTSRPHFDVVSLPYQNKDYSLLVLRPHSRSLAAVARLQKSLDGLDVSRLYSQLSQRLVRVLMPPFKIERRYELPANMRNLGIRRIFQARAEFGGITSRNIFVSNIIHKAVIDVNENGTTAAAAGVVIFRESVPIIVNFTADRPCFVFLYHKREKITLFAGLVANP